VLFFPPCSCISFDLINTSYVFFSFALVVATAAAALVAGYSYFVRLLLRSAYDCYSWDGEPSLTTCTMDYAGTLDYIMYCQVIPT